MKRLLLLVLLVLLNATAKSDFLSDAPINVEADKVEYIAIDNQEKIFYSGNVIASQDTQKVYANFVEYDVNKEILIASDKVKILEKEGYIIESDKVILSDKLKFGSLNNFTIITPDKSTLKGKLANKENEHLIDIKDGYYTACKICPGKAPIWEITAKSATLNQEEDSMSYSHPVFKFYGVPVLYAPYLSHYTSKAKRRSGFLRPSYGMSTYLGQAVKLPIYLNLAPNYDATVKPIITTQRGVIWDFEQRSLTSKGPVFSTGSVTSGSENQPKGHTSVDAGTRYHIYSKADFKLPYNNYAGWKTKFTSDKSYLKDYNYGNEDFLTTKVYNSAYQEKGYYEIQSLTFQNLRSTDTPNDLNQTPHVLPLFESKHNVHTFEDNSYLTLSSNVLNIHRYYQGADTNRYSTKAKWQKQVITDNGNKFNFFSSLRSDLYYYKQAAVNVNGQTSNYTGQVTRNIPEAGVSWSYPLARNFGQTNVTFEPLTNAIITPYSKYNNYIYNEDSPSSELNDGNLFSESQYTGLDLIENTPRVSYGTKTSVYYHSFLNTSLLLGQLYKKNPYDYISNTEGDKFSDYIGRWKVNLLDKVITTYQFSLDKDTYTNKTNEANIMLTHNKMFISSNLLYYKNNQVIGGIKNRREVSLETGINDYNNVSLAVYTTKNLTSKAQNPGISNGFVSIGSRIKYVNDCITYSATIDKDLTKNQDRKKNTTFWFDITLKNIN